MFPLQLLALVFVSLRRDDMKKREEETEGRAGGRTGGLLRGTGGLLRGTGGLLRGTGGLLRGTGGLLRRGDLLVVSRTLFTHFGIFLGGDKVAHFIPDILPVLSGDERRIKRMVTNSRLVLGVLAKRGSVRVDSVDDFAYGSEILVNSVDQVCSRPPLQGDEVARRAERLRGHVTYSLLWDNCEHFVMYCRYGTAMSFQTFQFCKTVRSLVLNRRVAKVTAVLGACLLLYVRAVSACSALLAVLVPFLLWMAA